MRLDVLVGVDPSLVATGLAVLFTYALHALIWYGVARAASSSKANAPATRHRLWKLALLGPCVSAPIAGLAPWRFGRWVSPHVVSLPDSSLSVSASSTPALTTYAWPSWLAFGFTVAAGLGIMRFALTIIRLRRRLSSRTRVRDARVLQQLELLCARAHWSSVLLTESSEIHSPLVIGRRELCVPSAMLRELGDSELSAVLGHELAHLERRDGIWFPVAGFIQSVLWMQPLNHWVAEHFRATAELACDDRAVELTGDRIGLARALVKVAQSALVAERPLVPTMAGSAAALRSRVRRLTATERPSLRAARVTERASLIASVAVCAIASLSSSIRIARSWQTRSHAPAQAAVTVEAGSSTERLDVLLRRDQELQTQLSQAEHWSEDHRDDLAFTVWRNELEQELRHVRAEAAWTEQRLGAVRDAPK